MQNPKCNVHIQSDVYTLTSSSPLVTEKENSKKIINVTVKHLTSLSAMRFYMMYIYLCECEMCKNIFVLEIVCYETNSAWKYFYRLLNDYS